MAGLSMMSMVVLAFKCLRFNRLALFRLLPRGGVLRIVYCVAFCCVIQVISLSSAAVAADEKIRKNGGFPARTPNNQFKRRCDRGQMGEFCRCERQSGAGARRRNHERSEVSGPAEAWVVRCLSCSVTRTEPCDAREVEASRGCLLLRQRLSAVCCYGNFRHPARPAARELRPKPLQPASQRQLIRR